MTRPAQFANVLLFATFQFAGEALKLLHFFRAGELLYVKGMSLLPTRKAMLLNGLADLFDRAGDFDRARATYEEAIRLDPSRPFHYWALGSLFERKGDAELAVKYYQDALRYGQRYSPEFRLLLERRVASLTK
jgi:tetratricopeptide (TPR) repeat protein